MQLQQLRANQQVMSLNAEHGDKSGASAGPAAGLQAPKLRSGGYAAWRPDMEVYLARIGAGSAHKRTMDKGQWLTLVAQVAAWSDEAVAAALADLGIGIDSGSAAAAGSTRSASSAPALTEREEATRKTIRLLVEQSTKAYGAIWSALSDELRVQASKGGEVPLNFAFGLWVWLEKKFQSTETDSIGELLAQWIALQQEEDESFDAYRARVNHLRTLLAHAKEPQSDNMYAYMLLDRLQPRYTQAVLALKAGGQIKDTAKIEWDTVTAFINAHERNEQRQTGGAGAAVIAHAARGGGAGGASGNAEKKERAGAPSWSQQRGGRFGGQAGGSGQQRGSAQPQHDRRTCFRCDQKGHIAATCPNPPKQAAAAGGEHASAALRSKPRQESRNRFEALSSDDEDEEKEAGSWSTTGKESAPESPAPLVAAAPQLAKSATAPTGQPTWADKVKQGQLGSKAAEQSAAQAPAAQVCAAPQLPQLDVVLANYAWGWDTMASSCCSGNRARFATLRKCTAVPVKVADGSIVEATHIGSVPLRVCLDSGRVVRIVIDDVLYHKRFSSNLLSGELLTSKKHGWQYHSTPECTYVVTPGGDRVTLSRRGRVSVLMCAEPELQRAAVAVVSGALGALGPSGLAAVEQLLTLHQRLNHMGWTRMMATLRSGAVQDMGVQLDALPKASLVAAEKHVRECTACLKGRATRTAFGHRGLDRGRKPGECIHLDSYQVKVPHMDGHSVVEHGLTAKCLYSDYWWHGRFQSKDQMAPAITALVQQIETQYGQVVKRLYTDGGTEFINQTLKAFCVKHGKELRYTPARSQQLNGGAERSVRTMKEYETMMIVHAGAPVRLWGYAGNHAAFVWNRTHISKETRMTPYEAMRGQKPSMKHLSVWGCDAFCHVPKEQRDALAPKAQACIYLGHNDTQNAATVLLLSTGKVIVSRDVTFRSDSFAFMRALDRGGDELRDALAVADAYSVSEADDGRRTALDAPQGGRAAPPNSEEYVVERIVGRRVKLGRVEYKVHWAGYDSSEDTWEPEAEVVELAAMDAWLGEQRQRPGAATVPPPAAATAAAPAAAAPRQSPRMHASTASLRASAQAEDANSADGSDAPQVHMVMSALRGLQLTEERPEPEAAMSAVASGVAALEQHTPRTYREAMASPDAPKWQAALGKEMRSCVEQEVWKLVRRDQLPNGANVLPCKEVFKVKVDEHGQVTEYKARFTPKGFRQKHGIDFFETYARTGLYKTLRVALSLVAKWDHELAQFDVPTAFLNAEVEEDIYMELPEGFEQPGMVCKLQKSLYGLKQAPRNWDQLVHAFITKTMGFKATVSDPSLYFRRSRSGRLMMIYRFVDDMQGSHHADDAVEFQECVKLLQDRFRIKQLQTATWMLGMRIERDRKAGTIKLTQELYLTKALEKFGLQECRVASSPEAVGAAHDANPELDAPASVQRYMEITGTVMYAAISTRPDTAHAAHYLASNMQAPTVRHMQAAERVLRYLAGTKDVGLVFGSRNGDTVGDSRGRKAQVQVDVCAFADADWANDRGDRRSISGWVAKVNGDPVSWSSKKQRVVALSTCEAELYAESAAIQEVLWLRGLMEELGLHTRMGSTVYGDNQSAIAVSQNGVKGERTKHVDVKYHFVTEAVERGVVSLKWIPTAQQQADIFTKALAAPVFELLRQQLMTR
jgi:Reverse transcriptase (RNA-dependent DNA polymerase)/Chromo (CHRromatin Organisation MOdifier) domain